MRRSMLALALIACEVEDEALLAGDQSPPPLVLQVGTLLAGQPLLLRVDGAVPGQPVRFARGTAAGAGPCPPVLRGACLDVVGPAIVATSTADAGGVAVAQIEVGLQVAVGTVFGFQAVQVHPTQAGLVSNAVGAVVAHPDDVCDRTGGGTWPSASADWECEVLAEVNALRALGATCGSAGSFAPTHPLVMNEAAQLAARVHTGWMVDNLQFSHSSPGGPLGATLGQRLTAAGYAPWRSVAENIHRGLPTPHQVVAQWRSSSAHCANMLDPAKRDAGVGYDLTAGGVPYWTLTLGLLW